MNWIIQFSEHLPPLVWNLILVAASLALGLILKACLVSVLKFNYRKTGYFLFQSLNQHLGTVALFFIPLVILNLLMPYMELTRFSRLQVDKLLEVALTISFALILMGFLKIAEDYVYHKYDYGKKDNLKERKVRTQLQFVRKFAVLLIALVTIALVLLSFENMRRIGSGLLTGVGVGGIIIGIAAQKSLSNLLAGFQIAFTQPMRIDDVLVVEGEFGRVEEITLTYVVLNIWDQRRLILPINYFIEKPFQNWTRTSSELLATVFLYVDYTLPVDEVRTELSRLLQNNSLWDERVGLLHVTDSKDAVIEIRALVSARSSGEAFDLRCYIRENLIKYIQLHYPQCLPKQRSEWNQSAADMPTLST